MSINSTVLETNVNLEVIHPRSILKWSIEVQSRSGPAVCAVAHNLATFLTARVETVRRRAFGSEGTSYHLILEDNERLFRSLVVIRGMCPCVHDSRHDKDKQENSVTTLFDLSAPDTRRYKMQWPFLILLTSLATVGIVAQATGQEVEILIGAGCAFSDYSTLPKATTSEPSYRLQLDPGLGKGIYVLYFAHFNLPESDVLILRASEGTEITPPVAALSGKNATGAFYSTAISGNGVVLELFKTPMPGQSRSTSCRGFTISRFLFTPQALVDEAQHLQVAVEVPLTNLTNMTDVDDNDHINNESLCGADESVEAACAPSATNSAEGEIMLAKSQPVARLSIIKDNGMVIAYCTGWLLGCEGHLITNQHCISNNQDALNTKVEFLAQSTSCGGGEACDSRGACPGPIGVTSTTLVAASEELDYAVVRIGTNDTVSNYSGLYEKTGGYLQLRASGAVLKESIYIPQHPLGYGKRIAWLYNGQPGRIESLTVTECREGDVGYYIDTQEGASGSPILATSDHTVIAMHHCGGCLNGAIPAQSIIEDLAAKGVLPKCSVAKAEQPHNV